MLHNSIKTGRMRLRHLLERTEAVSEAMEAERGRFERLADPGRAARAVSAFNLFQTPEPLADRLAGMFPEFGRTLEPSAGLGRLYRAIRERSGCEIVLVEIAPQCANELYRATAGDNAARLVQADFLECNAERLGGLFDCVVMNPPFKQGRDIKHINHARRLLASGGRVVSLCANGPRQRAKLLPEATEWIDLAAGTFKSEGTNVAAAIAVFES